MSVAFQGYFLYILTFLFSQDIFEQYPLKEKNIKSKKKNPIHYLDNALDKRIDKTEDRLQFPLFVSKKS